MISPAPLHSSQYSRVVPPSRLRSTLAALHVSRYTKEVEPLHRVVPTGSEGIQDRLGEDVSISELDPVEGLYGVEGSVPVRDDGFVVCSEEERREVGDVASDGEDGVA